MVTSRQPPRHPKTGLYLQRALFDGIARFSDLEDRISALPTKQERGDAFEVFVEAYLATQLLHQAKTVWPLSAVPIPLKERFALGTSDVGVDGLFETHAAQFHAYQAKFRTGRPSLTWEDLSTFLGLTDRIAERVVITNCSEITPIVNDRRGFYAVRGTDLDRLQPQDFEAIRKWLAGSVVNYERKIPLARQQQALDAILQTLAEHDRTTVLMPCGTGKTLVALWAAERLLARRILVLVPSLALISQTLHEWLKETRWVNASFLCVCSDPTVSSRARDSLVFHQGDVDFPVTTESERIRSFLERETDGVKIIFSTYQSAPVISEGTAKDRYFDLGVFDEAHKTTGYEGASFGSALKDSKIPIKKRLFMTATPRHYDVTKRDKNGEAPQVYSMDSPEIYGPVAYRMSFAAAVEEGLICGYRVIISVVTDAMVNDELLRRSTVLIGIDEVRARQVAHQLAVKEACERYGIGKVITFHKSVASAASFSANGAEGIAAHMPELEAFHVNGVMPNAKREAVMRAFATGTRTLISNARCLTEGIDVPAVDMVAFVAPRRSFVDVVQATGRAMRKSEGKTTGYVLIPIYLELSAGESLDEAVARGQYSDVWAVIQALLEHDEVLAQTIRAMRSHGRQTRGYDDRALADKVEIIGPLLSLDALRKAITTQIVDVTVDDYEGSWEEMFQQLAAFHRAHQHCLIPTLGGPYRALRRWIWRNRFFAHKLTDDRKAKLDSIAFPWTAEEAASQARSVERQRYIDKSIAFIEAFHARNGHCMVGCWTEDYEAQQNAQALWKAKRKGDLSEKQLASLDRLGFSDNPHEEDYRLHQLAKFKERYGHCNVPYDWSEDIQLARWVRDIRDSHKSYGCAFLKNDVLRQLEAIGFSWDPWESMYLGCLQYIEKFGGLDPVFPSHRRHGGLLSWLENQRIRWGRGDLGNLEIDKLKRMGVEPIIFK